MRRYLASALVLSSFSMFALVGCEDKTEVKSKDTVSSPTGTTTTEEKKTVESSGSNPPPSATGETGKDAMTPAPK